MDNILKKINRAIEVYFTRLCWGWRLYHLGKKAVLRRRMLMNNPKAVSIGSFVTIGKDYILADLDESNRSNKIIINDGCTINFRFQCSAAERVEIGRNVLIASNVFISDSDHILEPGIPVPKNKKLVTRPVVIEENCWIGQNAVILKGVRIGHDSIIGANAVVTKSIEPYSVAAGIPAKIIKKITI